MEIHRSLREMFRSIRNPGSRVRRATTTRNVQGPRQRSVPEHLSVPGCPATSRSYCLPSIRIRACEEHPEIPRHWKQSVEKEAREEEQKLMTDEWELILRGCFEITGSVPEGYTRFHRRRWHLSQRSRRSSD